MTLLHHHHLLRRHTYPPLLLTSLATPAVTLYRRPNNVPEDAADANSPSEESADPSASVLVGTRAVMGRGMRWVFWSCESPRMGRRRRRLWAAGEEGGWTQAGVGDDVDDPLSTSVTCTSSRSHVTCVSDMVERAAGNGVGCWRLWAAADGGSWPVGCGAQSGAPTVGSWWFAEVNVPVSTGAGVCAVLSSLGGLLWRPSREERRW